MKNHSFTTRDAHVFSNRVINFWNKLPDYVVQASSTASFKKVYLVLLTVQVRFNFVVFYSDV